VERCSAPLQGVRIEDIGETAAELLGAKIPGTTGRDVRQLQKR
jgi:hypothetical protein